MNNAVNTTHENSLRGGEPLRAGVLRVTTYAPATYLTKDGQAYFTFNYVERTEGSFEIDILKQPAYRGRLEDSHTAHRLISDRGGRKICIRSGHEPRSIELAKQISVEWAELTWAYILSGRTIDRQVEDRMRSNSPFQRFLERFKLNLN